MEKRHANGCWLNQLTTAVARGLLIFTTLIVGFAAPASASRFDDLQLVYHASFGNGSLKSGVDTLGIGPLRLGDSGPASENPSWTPVKGGYLLSVTRPPGIPFGSPSVAGAFATPVSFGVGSVVGLRATFVGPVGPRNSTDIWAVAVIVRPGGLDPIVEDPRAAVTLQVTGSGARLNTPGASTPANFPNLPQDIYDAIFHPTDPQPFTLELLVDRQLGRGEAKLKVGEAVFSRTYEFAVFTEDSGPVIGNVGANIAIAVGAGQTASVRVNDFQIFSNGPSGQQLSSDPLCPPEFGCRTVPPTP